MSEDWEGVDGTALRMLSLVSDLYPHHSAEVYQVHFCRCMCTTTMISSLSIWMRGSTSDLGCRTLYTDDGHLWGDHLNNWQHSTMYFAFMLSGAVDLLGIKLSLPTGTEQVRTCSHVSCAWIQLALRVAAGR